MTKILDTHKKRHVQSNKLEITCIYIRCHDRHMTQHMTAAIFPLPTTCHTLACVNYMSQLNFYKGCARVICAGSFRLMGLYLEWVNN